MSYDNLFYAGGNAPITCIGVPAGGFFDDYGVMFTLANGDLVDLYSNGVAGPGVYGVVVWAEARGTARARRACPWPLPNLQHGR